MTKDEVGEINVLGIWRYYIKMRLQYSGFDLYTYIIYKIHID